MATATAPILSVNPATEEVLASYPPFEQEAVERALDEAQDAFRAWRARSLDQRAVPMKHLASLLRERADRYARLLTLEMGKPITEAKAEIEKCAWNCEFYAANAEKFLRDEQAPSNAKRSYVAFEPLGIVLAVMPWNYPFWQVIRFAAPALMAGNAAVLKHASNVPQSALALEEVIRDAGFPEGLFRTLLLAGAPVGPVIGDPMDRQTQVGPLARGDLRDALERQVAESVRMGARVVTGGKRRGDKGFFYEPTVVADVTPDMPVFKEETFGPVAALMKVSDADEAVERANASEYGLGANLWTRDEQLADQLARRIESGQVFINGMVASDPRLP